MISNRSALTDLTEPDPFMVMAEMNNGLINGTLSRLPGKITNGPPRRFVWHLYLNDRGGPQPFVRKRTANVRKTRSRRRRRPIVVVFNLKLCKSFARICASAAFPSENKSVRGRIVHAAHTWIIRAAAPQSVQIIRVGSIHFVFAHSFHETNRPRD